MHTILVQNSSILARVKHMLILLCIVFMIQAANYMVFIVLNL